MGRHKAPLINRRRIEKEMKRKGVSRPKLAELIDMDYQSLSRCFHLGRMNGAALERLCKALDITTEYATAPDGTIAHDYIDGLPHNHDIDNIRALIDKHAPHWYEEVDMWRKIMIDSMILDLYRPKTSGLDRFTETCIQVSDRVRSDYGQRIEI